MAVTSCALDRHPHATVDEINIGTYTLRYIVQTNSTMGPQQVTLGALSSSPHPLPSLWQTYSYSGDTDSLSYARDYDIDSDPKSLNLWYITVTFKPPESGEGSRTSGSAPIMSVTNPITREAVVWWDREVTTINVLKDVDNKAIVNKCKDLYPDTVEIERPRGVLVAEFNVATLAEVVYACRQFDGAVNSTPWTVGGSTVPARAALCREVSASPPQREPSGLVFFHLIFRIVFAEDGATWDHPITEMGQYHWTKTGEAYDLIPITGHRKVTNAQKIVFLAEDGTRQSDDADAIITNWRIRREVNFNVLPI